MVAPAGAGAASASAAVWSIEGSENERQETKATQRDEMKKKEIDGVSP